MIIIICLRFSYKWKAVIPGSNWYHSHSSYQRGDGLFGMYVVRVPPQVEVHAQHYDYDLTDHQIVIQEWFHGVGICILGHPTVLYHLILLTCFLDKIYQSSNNIELELF